MKFSAYQMSITPKSTYVSKKTPIITKIALFLVAVTFNISRNYAINQQVKHYFCMTDMTGKYFFRDFLILKEQLNQ